jgi:hypothetical protein
MTNDLRFVAKINRPPDTKKTRHYVGLPPQLTEGRDLRHELETASVLLIERRPDGIFLLRFVADGHFVGDTWHVSIKDAKEQAKFEFNDQISEWRPVPPEVEDVVLFASQ